MCADILAAEDNRRQADLVGRYLRADGHRLLVVHDGRAALAEARGLQRLQCEPCCRCSPCSTTCRPPGIYRRKASDDRYSPMKAERIARLWR